MLYRTAISMPLPRIAWVALRNSLFAGPNAWLKQLALIFTIACALTCAYLWQSNAIAVIQKDTQQIQSKSAELEHSNVALMLQVAQWNNPAYIKQKARVGGLTPAKTPLVMQAPRPAAPAQSAPIGDAIQAETTALWRQLVEQISKPAAAVAQAAAWIR